MSTGVSTVTDHARAFREAIAQSLQIRSSIREPRPLPQEHLPEVVAASFEIYRNIVGSLEVLNETGTPRMGRDPALGGHLVHVAAFAVSRISRELRNEVQQDFLKHYSNTHDGKIMLPEWFRDACGCLEFTAPIESIPLKSALPEGHENTKPESIEEYYGSIQIVGWPRRDIVAAYSDLVTSFDRLVACVIQNRLQEFEMAFPFLSADRRPVLEMERLQIGDPRVFELPSLMECYWKLRELHADMLTMLARIAPQHFHESGAYIKPMALSLSQLFSAEEGEAKKCLAILLDGQGAELSNASYKLLTSRVAGVNPRTGGISWSTAFDDLLNIPLARWFIWKCLRATKEEFEEYLEALQTSEMKLRLKMIADIRGFFEQKKYADLAKYFVRVIDKTESDERSDAVQTRLNAALILSVLAQSAEAAAGLKNQITNLRKLSGVTELVAAHAGRDLPSYFLEELQSLSARIFTTLSMTLEDYFGYKKTKVEMRRVIDNFLYKCRHPEIGAGREPTEVGDNGVFLHGDPGVGKTFLVRCLAADYGLPLVRIDFGELTRSAPARRKSAGAGRPGDFDVPMGFNVDPLSFVQKKVDEAEKASKEGPVILFIDEFERVSHARTRTSDREVSQLTADMLQIIEQARLEAPNVFVIVATNYPNMVDTAMLREGRLDVMLPIRLPDAEDLMEIIQKTLEGEALYTGIIDPASARFSGEQLARLAQAAIGLLPLSIKKAVIDYIKFLPATGEQFSFEGLLKAIKFKVKSREYYIDRLEYERTQHAIPAARGERTG